jgi:FkbM family methyltransferase
MTVLTAMAAPIGLFAYNRADYVERALRALASCPELATSPLVIYCDGPKSEAGRAKVEATRAKARELAPAHAKIVEREANLGLRKSMRAGVSALCEEYGRAIILEDDLEVAPTFLRLMNDALDRYADDANVYQVSGYMYPVDIAGPNDAMFLPVTSCWGWGVWKRSWSKLDSGAALYDRLVDDAALRKRFDFDGGYPYFQMLEKQRRGEVDSWAISWYADVFANDGLVLYPRTSQVANRGHDGSGTHGETRSPFESDAHAGVVERFPAPALDGTAWKQLCAYIKRAQRREQIAAVKTRVADAVGRAPSMMRGLAKRLRSAVPSTYARQSYAQEGEDLILARIFGDQASGTYVDVGAHHPKRFSNTYLLYQRGWRGVNIDATPGSMVAFQRDRPRDTNIERGVTDSTETRRFSVFDDPALNTFDAARAKTLASTTPYRIVAQHDISCAPLAAILREHAMGPIDLLSIDVEGLDEVVLRTLDWDASRPRVLVAEQFSRDLEGHLASTMHRFLRERGYRLLAKTFNSVFYLRD